MRQRKRLLAAIASLAAALAFLGYRAYDYRRDREQVTLVTEDRVVREARALYESGEAAEALALLSRAHLEQPQNLGVALEYAFALYRAGDFEAAEAAVEELLSEAPNLPKALCLRGLIRREVGKLDESIADLEAAVAAEPDDAVFLYALARALVTRSGREAGRTAAAQADQDRALQLLQRAAALAPDPDILSDLAFVQKKLGQWSRAADTYRRLAELLPADPMPLVEASQCCRDGGDATRAADLARSALERSPHSAAAHAALARALRSAPSESVDADEYKRALRYWWDGGGGTDHTPALWLAEALVRENDLEAAEATLRKAIEDERQRRRPPNPEVHAQLARVLRDTGREQEAEAELATAQRLHEQWDPVGDLLNRINARPEDSRDERLALARLSLQLGWPHKALPYLEPLLDGHPPDTEAENLARELEAAGH